MGWPSSRSSSINTPNPPPKSSRGAKEICVPSTARRSEKWKTVENGREGERYRTRAVACPYYPWCLFLISLLKPKSIYWLVSFCNRWDVSLGFFNRGKVVWPRIFNLLCKYWQLPLLKIKLEQDVMPHVRV